MSVLSAVAVSRTVARSVKQFPRQPVNDGHHSRRVDGGRVARAEARISGAFARLSSTTVGASGGVTVLVLAAVSEEPGLQAVLSSCVWRVETEPAAQELGWAFLAPSLPAAAHHLFVQLPLTGQKSAELLIAYLLRPGTFVCGGGRRGVDTRNLFHLNVWRLATQSPPTPHHPSPFFMESKAGGHLLL